MSAFSEPGRPETRCESAVSRYCRDFPVVFSRASGEFMWDVDNKKYIDFLSAAGSLNYGHNHPAMRAACLAYLAQGGVIQSLDMSTPAKNDFIDAFHRDILEPRGLAYRLQLVGPTGADAVEAALRLAQKLRGTRTIVVFERSYHGVTAGARGISASVGPVSSCVQVVPFDSPDRSVEESQSLFTRALAGLGGPPSAVFLETVQGEGGVHPARTEWLRFVRSYCDRCGALLVIDDIQMGCGRTGPFFSFETAGIAPDMVCLSKSISGFGIPMAVLLLRAEHDVWTPGEHSGTFRGNGLAFACATAALRLWKDPEFLGQVGANSERLLFLARELAGRFPSLIHMVRGRGMVVGIEFLTSELAETVRWRAFRGGLICEVVGEPPTVLKVLPPLNISASSLEQGFEILKAVLASIG